MGCTSSRASHVTMKSYDTMTSDGPGTRKVLRGEPDGEEKFGDICKYAFIEWMHLSMFSTRAGEGERGLLMAGLLQRITQF